MATRSWWMDLTLVSALVLGLALLLISDTDGAIPRECPELDLGSITVNLAHETSCTKYYKCGGGKKYLKECPIIDAQGNKLYFNRVLQACDWPRNVHCKLPEPNIVMSKVTIPKICPKIDPLNYTVQLPHETDCTKFYKCLRGKKYEKSCPALDNQGNKLYYNPTTQVCDWPWNVDCKLLKPQRVIDPLIKISTMCPQVDTVNHTKLAHETDCTKFYKCIRGEKFLMDCPPLDDKGNKLYFNAALQLCDFPWNVHCKFLNHAE